MKKYRKRSYFRHIDKKKFYESFIESDLGGRRNFSSLIESYKEYQYMDVDDECPPSIDVYFDVPDRCGIIALKIIKNRNDELILDFLINGYRTRAYLSEEAFDYFLSEQENLYWDSNFNKKEIENFRYIKGQPYMIESEGFYISDIKIIDKDIFEEVAEDELFYIY